MEPCNKRYIPYFLYETQKNNVSIQVPYQQWHCPPEPWQLVCPEASAHALSWQEGEGAAWGSQNGPSDSCNAALQMQLWAAVGN